MKYSKMFSTHFKVINICPFLIVLLLVVIYNNINAAANGRITAAVQ